MIKMDTYSDVQLYFLMDLFAVWPWHYDASNLINVQRELIRRLLTRMRHMEHKLTIQTLPKLRVRMRTRPKIGYQQVFIV